MAEGGEERTLVADAAGRVVGVHHRNRHRATVSQISHFFNARLDCTTNVQSRLQKKLPERRASLVFLA